MASIAVATFEDWYRMAGEFFKACTETTSPQAINAGYKALNLGWIGLQAQTSAIEETRAEIILRMACKRAVMAEHAAGYH